MIVQSRGSQRGDGRVFAAVPGVRCGGRKFYPIFHFAGFSAACGSADPDAILHATPQQVALRKTEGGPSPGPETSAGHYFQILIFASV